MIGSKSTKPILGYVSAYLRQPRRSLAEAERDQEVQLSFDQEAESLVGANAAREAKRKPPVI